MVEQTNTQSTAAGESPTSKSSKLKWAELEGAHQAGVFLCLGKTQLSELTDETRSQVAGYILEILSWPDPGRSDKPYDVVMQEYDDVMSDEPALEEQGVAPMGGQPAEEAEDPIFNVFKGIGLIPMKCAPYEHKAEQPRARVSLQRVQNRPLEVAQGNRRSKASMNRKVTPAGARRSARRTIFMSAGFVKHPPKPKVEELSEDCNMDQWGRYEKSVKRAFFYPPFSVTGANLVTAMGARTCLMYAVAQHVQGKPALEAILAAVRTAHPNHGQDGPDARVTDGMTLQQMVAANAIAARRHPEYVPFRLWSMVSRRGMSVMDWEILEYQQPDVDRSRFKDRALVLVKIRDEDAHWIAVNRPRPGTAVDRVQIDPTWLMPVDETEGCYPQRDRQTLVEAEAELVAELFGMQKHAEAEERALLALGYSIFLEAMGDDLGQPVPEKIVEDKGPGSVNSDDDQPLLVVSPSRGNARGIVRIGSWSWSTGSVDTASTNRGEEGLAAEPDAPETWEEDSNYWVNTALVGAGIREVVGSDMMTDGEDVMSDAASDPDEPTLLTPGRRVKRRLTATASAATAAAAIAARATAKAAKAAAAAGSKVLHQTANGVAARGNHVLRGCKGFFKRKPAQPIVDRDTPFSFVAVDSHAPQPTRAWHCRLYPQKRTPQHARAVNGARTMGGNRKEYGRGLVELTPALNTSSANFFGEKCWYYVDPWAMPAADKPGFLTNGQYDPDAIVGFTIKRRVYELVQEGLHWGVRCYSLRLVARINDPWTWSFKGVVYPMFNPISDAVTSFLVALHMGVRRAPVVGLGNRPLPMEASNDIPGVEGVLKMQWGLVRGRCPEAVRAQVTLLSQMNHTTLPFGQTPESLTIEVMKRDSRLQQVFTDAPGFSVKPRKPRKSCTCCGKPAVPPFKWQWFRCGECKRMLERDGAITILGRQIQDNLVGASGAPGWVNIKSDYLPPNKTKWAKVDVRPGDITAAPGEPGLPRKPVKVSAKGRKFIELEPEDLAKIPDDSFPAKFEATLCGIGISGTRPRVSKKAHNTMLQALMGRAFLKKPTCDPAAWAALTTVMYELLPDLKSEIMTISSWIASMPTRRRRPLIQAAKDYLSRGLLDKDLGFKCFIKTEALASFEPDENQEVTAKTEAIARMIMGPVDLAHIVAGPILKPKLDRLKEHWGLDNWLTYGSINPQKLQKWLDEASTEEVFVFWCDYAMFDCTHSDHSFDLVERYYVEMGSSPDFERVMRAWRNPKGRAGIYKFKARTMLASGTDDTALKNAVVNGLVMSMAIAAALACKEVTGVTIQDLREAKAICRFSICGDDTLGFLPLSLWGRREQLMTDIEEGIKKFGLVPKLDCSDYLGHGVYLGMRPYNVPYEGGRKWVWGRTVGRASYKLSYMIELKKGDPMAWVTGVADQVVRTMGHVPVYSDLCRRILELRKGAKRRVVATDPNKPWQSDETLIEGLTEALAYDRDTVHFLMQCYARQTYQQIKENKPMLVVPTVDDVYDAIKRIYEVPCLPYNLDHWVLRFFCLFDDC